MLTPVLTTIHKQSTNEEFANSYARLKHEIKAAPRAYTALSGQVCGVIEGVDPGNFVYFPDQDYAVYHFGQPIEKMVVVIINLGKISRIILAGSKGVTATSEDISDLIVTQADKIKSNVY